jgi:DNA helicase-2/ATP-dependent DNA helicase PcrA
LADVLDSTNDLYPFSQNLNWSQWAKGLKNYTEGFWPLLPAKGKLWGAVSRRIRAPRNRGKINIAEEIQGISPTSNLRITTIHDVKGETFEALMLISSKDRRSKGGHFEQWLRPEPGNEEYQRFSYVACSRPEHLLVVATPPLSENQLQELVDLGLEPQEMISEMSSEETVTLAGDSVAA